MTKKKSLNPLNNVQSSLFGQSVRTLTSDDQKAAWDIASKFALAPLVNCCCDQTYDKFVSGVYNALNYIKQKAVNTAAIDYAAFVLSCIKTALSVDEAHYKSAYTDMMKALGLGEKQSYDSPEINEYFDICDNSFYQNGSYDTSKYMSEYDSDVYNLQKALQNAGFTDKYGNEIEPDGLFGPQTYYAALMLKG